MELIQAVGATAAFVLTAYVLNVRRRARPAHKPGISESVVRLLQFGRRKLLSSMLDVGGFFGCDIGGSLTKLIMFLPDPELIDRLVKRAPSEHVEKSHWHDKLASVQDLSKFMLSRVTYGATGVRDAHLSFHITELGGSFHFVR